MKKISSVIFVCFFWMPGISAAQSVCFYDAVLGGPLQHSGGISGTGIYGIVAYDFNHDGIMDIATTNCASHTISVLTGNLSGIFNAPVNYQGQGCMSGITVADINNDSIIDIIATDQATNAVGIFTGVGNGTFNNAVFYPVGGCPYFVAAADFNHDGYLDLATCNNGSSDISVLINNGNGTFAPAVSYPVGADAWGLACADFNNDTIPDLLIANAFSHSVTLMKGNGNGTLASPVHMSVNYLGLNVAAADINGDGNMDFVVNYFDSSYVSIHYGDGAGNFSSSVYLPVASFQLSYTTYRDINNDGHNDLVFAVYNSNGFGYMLNDGTNNFLPVEYYLSAVDPEEIAVEDFNNDGWLDVVVPSSYDPLFSCMLNCSPSGINSFSATDESTNIFPNPTTDELKIKNSELKIKFIEIYDTLGEKIFVQQQTASQKLQTINISNLPPGIYFIKVFSGEKTITQRVVKM